MTCMKRCRKSRTSWRKTPASTMPWDARSVPIFPSLDGDSVTWKWWQEEAQRATLSMLCLGWFVRDSRIKKNTFFLFLLRRISIVKIGDRRRWTWTLTQDSYHHVITTQDQRICLSKSTWDSIREARVRSDLIWFCKKNTKHSESQTKRHFVINCGTSKELLFCSEMTFDELNGLMVLLAIRDSFWNGSIGRLFFFHCLCKSQSEHEKIYCQNLSPKYLKVEKQKVDMDHVDTAELDWVQVVFARARILPRLCHPVNAHIRSRWETMLDRWKNDALGFTYFHDSWGRLLFWGVLGLFWLGFLK